MMKKIVVALLSVVVASCSAFAQGGPSGGGPGPGPPPSPWVVSGSTISYSNGGVVLPSSVPGGTKGIGTINVSGGYYVNGVKLNAVTSATNPLAFTGGVLSINLDSNFAVSGINLALAPIASGALLANAGAGSAEPTAATPSAWLSRWCSASADQVPYSTGASTWGCLGLLGTAHTWTAAQAVSLNSGALQAAQTGTVLRLANANGTATRLELDAYGAQAFFTALCAGGTAASPTALTAATQCGGYNMFGYDGTAFAGPAATFRTFANQNWAVGAHGTYAEIAITPNGSTTLTVACRFENDGGVTCPNTVTGGSKGAGTLNATGLYVNGSAVSTGSGTVTSIATNNGVTGGTITTTGTIGLATIAADNLLMNSTGSTAVPIATAVGSCSAASSALTYNTSTHAFGCNTVSGAVSSVSNSDGTLTISPTTGAVVASLALGHANTWTAAQTISGASFALSGNISAAAWTTLGVRYKNVVATLTDTTSSGTVAEAYSSLWPQDTISASSSVTYTNYYTAFFRTPTTGTNVAFSNKWAIGADNLRVGVTTQLSISTTGDLTFGSITGSTQCLHVNTNGLVSGTGSDCGSGSSGLTVGTTTITSGTTTRILYDNAGTLGEYTITGTGTVVAMQTSPTFVTNLTTPIANLSGTSNQLVFQSGGVTGTISWTPASTNKTITLPNGTTDFTGTSGIVQQASAGAAITVGSVALSNLATQATNTVVGNATSGTAAPTALTVGSCSTAASALIWTTNTGFGCNTSITAAAVPASGLTGTTLASNVVTSSLTSVGTLAGLTVTGSFTATGLVTNADLANASTTVNSVTCTLGSSCTISAAASLVIASTTITSGTDKRILYDNAGVLGEYTLTGTGTVAVMQTSPSLITPALGVATATSLAIGGGTIGSDKLEVTGTTTLNGAVVVSAASFGLSGNISAAAWTTSGVRYANVVGTLTDTSSSGTVATAYTDVFGGNTIAASSAATFTNYVSLYVKDPVAGTNVTLTNKWALGGDSLRIGTSNQLKVSTAGALTIGNITGSTQCLHVDTNGTVTGTGSDCGSAGGGITGLTGDVTASGSGSVAATVVNLPTGVTMAGYLLATEIAAPSTPAAGKVSIWVDSTNARFHDINPAGTIGTTVVADTGASNNFLTAISAAGVISKARPTCGSLSDSSTGCTTTVGTMATQNASAVAITGGTLAGLTGLAIRDTSAAFDVTLAATSSTTLTAGRTLTIDMVNAARTLKLGANLTIASDPGTVTGALKSNGSGTFAQAACADLSNGATGCSTATGTSGATIPLLNGTNTASGVWTHTAAAPQLVLGVNTTTLGSIKLFGSTSGDITIGAAAVAGTANVFTLPPTKGSSGQFLQTDGTGVTIWATASGSGSVTSVTCNAGLTGGVITTTGTCALDLTSANTFTAVQSVSIAPAANTSGDGLVLSDATAASSGNQQYSPRLRLTGQGWKTTATAASQAVDWIMENQPVQGTTNPSSNLVWSSQVNAGGYTARMALSSAGAVAITSASANALAVGLNGATNPALQVDASTATSVTGLKIKSAASGSGTNISTISSASNEALYIDAKGNGQIYIGTISTGQINYSNPVNLTGNFNINSNTMTFPGAAAIIAALTVADQTLSGGANVTTGDLGTKSSGTLTIDCGLVPLQKVVNGGAFTLAAPSNDGSCIVQITNNASAGTITFSGFTVGSSTGAALTTTNTNKFFLSIARINGSAIYTILAQQ